MHPLVLLAALLTPVAVFAQQRPTFHESVDEMVVRYNGMMRQMNPQLVLPSRKGLKEGARNESWHLLERQVTPEITVMFEVDNSTGRPFSLNMMGHAGDGKIAALLAVMSAIGATTFGKGEDAGAVVRACSQATEKKSKSVETVVRGIKAYCAVVNGVWIAGTNVVDPRKQPN